MEVHEVKLCFHLMKRKLYFFFVEVKVNCNHVTRLETRTKEFDTYTSRRGYPLRHKEMEWIIRFQTKV